MYQLNYRSLVRGLRLLSSQGNTSFLRKARDVYHRLAIENSSNSQSKSLLYDGKFLLPHLDLITTSYQYGLCSGPMLLYPTLVNNLDYHPSAQSVLKQS